MRRKMLGMVAVGVWALWPATASACDLYLAYTYLGVPTGSLAVGGGLVASPMSGDTDTFLMPSVDLGIRLGDRAVVRPALGLCNGPDDNEIILGAGGSFNIWRDASSGSALNVQAHLARTSTDGFTTMSIPIVGSGIYPLTDSASIFGTLGVQMLRWSYESLSNSDTNLVAATGVRFSTGSTDISAGINIVNTDDDTDLGLIAGVSIPFR